MITPGTILIERDTLRPEFFDVVEGSYPNSFMSLTNALPPHELESELSRAGWAFFYMAGMITATIGAWPNQLTGPSPRCVSPTFSEPL